MRRRHIIAMDTSSEVSCVCVLKPSGRIGFETKVLTTSEGLKSLVRSVPRPREVIFEESCQAAWLYSVLEPLSDVITVCDPTKNAELLKKCKGDEVDARHLGQWGRAGLLSRVWHGGVVFQELRETLRLYQALMCHSTKLKNQIRAVFRSRGVKGGSRAYKPESRTEAASELPFAFLRQRVESLGAVLDSVTPEREAAREQLIRLAKRQPMYRNIVQIDGFGPILTAMFIAEVCDPHRFRTRHQFWSYCGLAVVTHGTGEYYTDSQGTICRNRKKTRTRGLVKKYNRTLKYVFKHAAFVASRYQLKEHYGHTRRGTSNDANAQLTLARKLAAVALRIAKTGESYDVERAFTQH